MLVSASNRQQACITNAQAANTSSDMSPISVNVRVSQLEIQPIPIEPEPDAAYQ